MAAAAIGTFSALSPRFSLSAGRDPNLPVSLLSGTIYLYAVETWETLFKRELDCLDGEEV